jgi:hypothetical protein
MVAQQTVRVILQNPHGIDDDRLKAVADFVHDWLFGGKGGQA